MKLKSWWQRKGVDVDAILFAFLSIALAILLLVLLMIPMLAQGWR